MRGNRDFKNYQNPCHRFLGVELVNSRTYMVEDEESVQAGFFSLELDRFLVKGCFNLRDNSRDNFSLR